MFRRPTLLVVLFAVLASCGSASEVPEDTTPVAAETPLLRPHLPSESKSAPSLPPNHVTASNLVAGVETSIGFTGETRFVLFAEKEAPSFLVFDRQRNETFRVFGEPMGKPVSEFDPLEEMGVTGPARTMHLEGATNGRLLVRSTAGVQLVDLADHGRLTASWYGIPLEASLAPDGETFAVATQAALHIVRASDGAFFTSTVQFGDQSTLQWGNETVFWISGKTLTRVDRKSLVPKTVQTTQAAESTFAMSANAEIVAIKNGNFVSIFANEKDPILRLRAPNAGEIYVDKEGTNVVWAERVIDEKTLTDKGHIHAVNIANRTHIRFAMRNSGCGIAPETIESVKGGHITTDPSCSIGCPSVRWTHKSITYDAKSGVIVDESSWTEALSWSEEQEERRASLEKLTEKLDVKFDHLMHHPGGRAVLVARQDGLTLEAIAQNSPSIVFEDSEEATLSAFSFSSDGKYLAGRIGQRARVWDATTGRALLR